MILVCDLEALKGVGSSFEKRWEESGLVTRGKKSHLYGRASESRKSVGMAAICSFEPYAAVAKQLQSSTLKHLFM